MVELVYRVEHKRKHEKLSFSNYTVHCHMNDIYQDISNQIADEIRTNKARISLQLVESINVSNWSYLLVNCRCVHADLLK